MKQENETKNEFDDFDGDELPPETFENEQELEDNKTSDLLSQSGAGVKYDWQKAPDYVKAPPRENLDKKKVTIVKADIILPPNHTPWVTAKTNKDIEYKYCIFKLFYDVNGQQEFYSGVRVFKREEDGKVKYSHPTITKDRNNQASKLLGVYADYKEKDINEVSLKEFMAFLNSKPKAIIGVEKYKNPNTGKFIEKNMVEKFI